jgi:hypothetical protein
MSAIKDAFELDASRTLVCLALRQQERIEEKRKEALQSWVKYWPIGAGLLISIFAPMLRDVAADWAPWGMRILFPFVVLCSRPEVALGMDPHQLGDFMLFAQFPLEGLLAKILLRGRVKPKAVAGQIFVYHLLTAMLLWLLSASTK